MNLSVLKSLVIVKDKVIGVVNCYNNQVFHKPVMLQQVLNGLNCSPGKIYVDCTLGGAGHSVAITQAIQPGGRLVCLDVDEEAINEASLKLASFNNVSIIKSNFVYIAEIAKSMNLTKVDGGILIDLGTSYYQLTSSTRGFSFQYESSLDMRMDKSIQITAYDIINNSSVDELTRIFSEYGEERYSKRIAQAIVKVSEKNKIETTTQLADLVKSVVPNSYKSRIHPATRVFQALRIKVNNELEILDKTLNSILDLLAPGARIVIITFHSLEDRIVKKFFKHWSIECVCNPKLIECKCNHSSKLKIITKKPLLANDDELKYNPSSRSANGVRI